jgi:hypothetical protein
MKLAKEYKNPIPKGNSEEDVNKRNEIIVGERKNKKIIHYCITKK